MFLDLQVVCEAQDSRPSGVVEHPWVLETEPPSLHPPSPPDSCRTSTKFLPIQSEVKNEMKTMSKSCKQAVKVTLEKNVLSNIKLQMQCIKGVISITLG